MGSKSKKIKIIAIKKFSVIIFIFLIIIFLISIVNAQQPVPHGVSGIIFELDGITQVRKGIDFYVHNLNNGHIINGKTGHGSSGGYSVAIKGKDGDTIVIKAWNKYNQVNATLELIGVMRNVNLWLNMTYPPIEPNITSNPITNAVAGKLYTYDVEAFDENEEDILEYGLAEAPTGMNINESNGLIKWLPLQEHVGNNNVTAQVTDGLFLTNQSFTINVENAKETSGKTSISITDAVKDANYSNANAADKYNDTLIHSQADKPHREYEVANATIDTRIKVEELTERPKGVKRISRRVYKYLKIENIEGFSEDATINFTVDLGWLSENEIKYNDIVLSRYAEKEWEELTTEFIGKYDEFAHYAAKTPGFSYFAITVGEGVTVKNILKPQVSAIKVPFKIFGTIYRFGKLKQVEPGTKFSITNLNTSEAVEGQTGIGPNTGAYFVLLHGKEGDLIKIKIAGIDKEFFTTLEERDNLDFMLNLKGNGLSMITGYGIFGKFGLKGTGLAVILIISIILAVIFIKFKYKKR